MSTDAQKLFQAALSQQRQQKLQEAAGLYSQLLRAYPQHTESLYNLATCYAQLQQWETAIQFYKLALQQRPSAVEILFNLSVAYLSTEQSGAAIHHLKQVIAYKPEHAEAQHLLACLLFKSGLLQEAEQHFAAALPISAEPGQVAFNHAVMELQRHAMEKAIKLFQQAVQHDEKLLEAHYNLGICWQTLANDAAAMHAFQQALSLEPEHFESLFHLTLLSRQNGQLQQAVHYCERALQLQDSPTLAFVKTSMQQSNAEMPPQFSRQLFNYYAAHYDQHLLSTLHYQVPDAIKHMLHSLAIDKLLQDKTILDLGCGTGLMAEQVVIDDSYWLGVDISPAMLQQAHIKKLYDELHEEDAANFLQSNTTPVDLIIAADLFMYIHDYQALLQAATARLPAQGYFCFSTESCLSAEFKLADSLRYQHSEAAIQQALAVLPLQLLAQKQVVIRMQEQQPLLGTIWCVQKCIYNSA